MRPITFELIQAYVEQVVREFDPDKIILFGSHGRGEATADSDVDLLVILPFDGRSFLKSVEILQRVTPEFPCDLFARRPDDSARRYAEYDPLIRDAFDNGKVLYDRYHRTVA